MRSRRLPSPTSCCDREGYAEPGRSHQGHIERETQSGSAQRAYQPTFYAGLATIFIQYIVHEYEPMHLNELCHEEALDPL
jgi:hypothetical protein